MSDEDKNVRLSADVHAKAKAEKQQTGETWDQLVLRAIGEGGGPDLEEIRQVMREELERDREESKVEKRARQEHQNWQRQKRED